MFHNSFSISCYSMFYAQKVPLLGPKNKKNRNLPPLTIRHGRVIVVVYSNLVSFYMFINLFTGFHGKKIKHEKLFADTHLIF